MTEALGVRTWQVLECLADGRFHSGEVIAQTLGVSRASVFNALEGIAQRGIEVQRVRGRGYRLAQPWQPLDKREIAHELGGMASKFDIEIVREADSSNTLLMQRAALGAPSGSMAAVEWQRAGRGRLGRVWHSGLGNALTFSLLWRFERGLNALSGLSLAVGIAVMRALERADVRGAGLKWPNDILYERADGRMAKLGGVLIEAQGDMLGPSAVVIGLGLNLRLPETLRQAIDQPACALDELCGTLPERNRLLALLLEELAGVLGDFERGGFVALRTEWEGWDVHRDRQVSLHLPDGKVLDGIARGVGDDGSLRLETAQGMRLIHSGEVGGAR